MSLPGSGGLQQVKAGVDVGSDPLRQHLRVLSGHGGQVQGAGGRVGLPGPEKTIRKEDKHVTAASNLITIRLSVIVFNENGIKIKTKYPESI